METSSGKRKSGENAADAIDGDCLKQKKKIDLTVFALIYFALFFIAVAFNQHNVYLKFPKMDDTFAVLMSLDVILGLAIGLLIVFLTSLLSKYNKSMKELITQFQKILGPLSKSQIFFIAFFSSVSEEFFFRGLVQFYIGLIPTAIIFAALHSGPGKKYFPWTIFAFVMGILLGGLYEWRGNLILPVVIHFVVNFINLSLMQKKPQRRKTADQ
jgi:membrane protease YdiL (CAAX protease family)